MTGYVAGYSSQGVAERARIYDRLERWMRINGPLTVLILSAVPNPFFDLAGAAAGVLRMPVRKFLVWCWIGETAKMMGFAVLGSLSIKGFS